jgi:hypothetical protein
VLPVRDLALQRSARAVAFTLGLLALPDAGPASVASVELTLDAEALAARVALPATAIEDAFRALWVADVLRHGEAPGHARFADDVVPETPLAYALRWSTLADRLLDRRGEGALAAVVLFRLVLDRLSHPHAPVTLPASLVQEQLGLSEDQSRRGFRLLLQRELLVERAQAGRARQLLLAPSILLGEPQDEPAAGRAGMTLVGAAAAPVASAAPIAAPAPAAAAAAPVPPAAPAPVASAAPTGLGPILEYAGQRIELPAQAELSMAVPGTRVAGMRVDPATGRLVVVLEPAG